MPGFPPTLRVEGASLSHFPRDTPSCKAALPECCACLRGDSLLIDWHRCPAPLAAALLPGPKRCHLVYLTFRAPGNRDLRTGSSRRGHTFR